MTTAAPPSPPLAPPPLLRPREGRVVRGVCAAVARSTGTDPVLWRVVVAVMTVFGGGGLVLYVVGWLVIPEEGGDGPVVDRWLKGRRPGTRTAVLLVVALLVLVGLDGDASTAAVLVAAGLLLHLRLRALPSVPVLAQPPYELVPGTAPAAPVPALPRARSEPHPSRPPLLLPVLGVAVFFSVTSLLRSETTLVQVLVVELLVVVFLVVRGARRLPGVLLAVLLAAVLVPSLLVRVPVDLSAGTRTWTPSASVPSYDLGAGDATLRLTPGAGSDVDADVAFGVLRVVVPRDVHVEVTTSVRAGALLLPGEGLRRGVQQEQVRTYGPSGGPLVRVAARVGAGRLDVQLLP